MSRPNPRTVDLEKRQVSPAIVLGGAVAWLFIGSTVFSLLAM